MGWAGVKWDELLFYFLPFVHVLAINVVFDYLFEKLIICFVKKKKFCNVDDMNVEYECCFGLVLCWGYQEEPPVSDESVSFWECQEESPVCFLTDPNARLSGLTVLCLARAGVASI